MKYGVFMEEKKLRLLEGMDSYLPHVDGVINCMNNYCLNDYKEVDLTAIAPKYKNYVDKVPYNLIRCKSMYVPILDIQYCQATRDKKFTKEILSKKYDIVHVNSPFNMAKFMLKIAKAEHIPAVATFHSNMRPIFKSIVKSNWLTEKLVKKLANVYNQYDEIFVCSPLVEKQLRSYGYNGSISYLPFGTDLKRCDNKEELVEKANQKLGINKNDLVFIYVGRIEKLKRVDFILNSLKILKDNGVKFKFFAIGKGSDIKKMIKLKSKLGLSNEEVVFTGFIDRELFPLMYARANLLLFPSLYDNFGLVKVEAAAFSTPGLFIENSCAGYGVKDCVNGYLSKNSCIDFANKIMEVIKDRDLLSIVGKNASRDLYISWKDCTEQYVQRLKEIVERVKKEDLEVLKNDNKK
jgi:1,2-diacylglycerol 3-alpha-glucosyltransferase